MKIPIVITFCAMIFLGCSRMESAPAAPTVEKKALNTTLRGTITKAGQKYFLKSPGQATTELDSYTVKLDLFVDKTVSVTGQYSGTTLFVDTVQAN